MKEPNIGYSSRICPHTVTCNKMSHKLHVSLYTQLHKTTVPHSSGICLNTSYKHLAATVHVSVYTQLHITNCQQQYNSLLNTFSCNQLSVKLMSPSTHSFIKPTISHSSHLSLHTASSNQLSPHTTSLSTQLHITKNYPQPMSLSTHSFM